MAEAEIEINGGIVVYEFVGRRTARSWCHPGGRFSKDYGGVHELADALADGRQAGAAGDRPNCGRSDIQLYGQSESHMRAETLACCCKSWASRGRRGRRFRRRPGHDRLHAACTPSWSPKLRCGASSAATYSRMSLAGVYIMNELATVGPAASRASST